MPVLFCLGIQPKCLNVVSYSESGLLQAKGFALFPRVKQSINGSPVVPFRFCDGAHRFLKQQAGRLSTRGVAMHGPIGDSGPMALFDCPGGHRVAPETRMLEAWA